MRTKAPFEFALTAEPTDIDNMGHVNNVVYVRWVQEVAAAHWNHVASTTLQGKYAWVVLKHEIEYRHAAFLKDNIIGHTWVGDHHGARFDRFVKFTRGSTVLAEAKTTWCLLEASRLRPIRIPQEIITLL